jgi:type II secretory pathway pseudopilin PulG
MALNIKTGSRNLQNMSYAKPYLATFRAAARLADLRRQRGFTYVGVLVLVALMGIALAAAGQVWHTFQKREKERELLFIGQQFRLALNRYARHTPGPARRAPLRLEELVQDPRYPGTHRYLRKIYVDPVTGDTEWGLITGPGGEIYGVHSLSREEPLKKSGFALADRNFEGAMKYSDWVFMQARN